MIPHYFKKEKIPEKLPKEIEQITEQLKNSVDKEDCLRKAYDIIARIPLILKKRSLGEERRDLVGQSHSIESP